VPAQISREAATSSVGLFVSFRPSRSCPPGNGWWHACTSCTQFARASCKPTPSLPFHSVVPLFRDLARVLAQPAAAHTAHRHQLFKHTGSGGVAARPLGSMAAPRRFTLASILLLVLLSRAQAAEEHPIVRFGVPGTPIANLTGAAQLQPRRVTKINLRMTPARLTVRAVGGAFGPPLPISTPLASAAAPLIPAPGPAPINAKLHNDGELHASLETSRGRPC